MRLFDMDSKEDYLLDGKYKVATPYAPLVNVVEVVRCKDCKHFKSQTENTGVCDGGFCHAPMHVAVIDYCSHGERKDDDKSCDTCKYYDDDWCSGACDDCKRNPSYWERKDDE